MTEVEIPRSALSAWTAEGGRRELRRELTVTERRALEARRDELAPALAPFAPGDADRVALALADMFGGFTQMRQSDGEAAARLDSAMRVLAEFPAWAITKACRSIQANGVWRDGKFDRRWPPSDAEIVHEVRGCVRLYADPHRSAVALLEAEVELQ